MSQQSVAHQPLDGQGGVDINLPIRAVNGGSEPVVWQYDRVKYTLLPGQETFIPYLAMVLYQGDPRAVNLAGRPRHEQYRANEYERLRIVCGVYENDSAWATVPHVNVTCYPINSDVPFNTVLRDPEGVNMVETPGSQGAQQTEFLQRQLAEMADQMRVMQAQLQSQQAADDARAVANITSPADLPSQATSAKTVAPEGLDMTPPAPVSKASPSKQKPKPGEGPQVTKDQ